MKTLNKKILQTTMTSILLLNSGISVAATAWATTAFWRAPQITEMNAKVKVLQKELAPACELYKNMIHSVSAQGNYPGLSKKVDRLRKTILPGSPMNVTDFAASFEFKNAQNASAFLEETIDLSNALTVDDSKEPLPYYTHLRSTTGISINEVKALDIDFVEGKQSLSKFSRDLGLDDSEINIEDDINGISSLSVLGLDVACDLLMGNIVLKARAPSYVKLPLSEMSELNVFYFNRLSPELNRIMGSKESITVKSARLGFQMGRIVEEDLRPREMAVTEGHIKGLFDVLFVPKTLDSSSNLIEMNKKKVINLVSSTEANPVNLTISIE